MLSCSSKVTCVFQQCSALGTLDSSDLHGFYKWVFDALGVFNDFVRQVVNTRKDSGLHRWACWSRVDLGSRPYAWLRPDFGSPPLPFLSLSILLLRLLSFWRSLISLMLSSVRPGCLSFASRSIR